MKSLSCVRLLVTPWTAAYQAPLSMGFSRQEYWSGVPLPSPHSYMTTGKTIALTRQTFVGKVMSLLFNMLSRLVLGKGNGNPLQYSCLENPMDGGAWWAAVHGVTKSRTQLSDFTFTHWRRKWQPTPMFFPGESQGRGSLVGCHLWGCTESDMTEVT